jgi:hypothetical protein
MLRGWKAKYYMLIIFFSPGHELTITPLTFQVVRCCTLGFSHFNTSGTYTVRYCCCLAWAANDIFSILGSFYSAMGCPNSERDVEYGMKKYLHIADFILSWDEITRLFWEAWLASSHLNSMAVNANYSPLVVVVNFICLSSINEPRGVTLLGRTA